MNYVINKNDPSPAYLQLYKSLRADIVAGEYKFGERLPSKRTVAEKSGVSVITAAHAYDLLCDEGYAEARKRSGFFVSFSRDDGFAGYEKQKAPAVRREAARSGGFPASLLAKHMRRVTAESANRLFDRGENSGVYELRLAVCRYLARSRGIYVDAEQIVIGSGSEYFYRLMPALLGRGLTFGIEAPSYMKIEEIYRAEGVKIERLPLGENGIQSAAIKQSRADVLHISPYRSFPSGVSADARKRHEYLRWAEKPGRFIIEDDFESEFSVSKKPEETLFANQKNENVIYLNSFSLTVSPAMRAGYAVFPRGLSSDYEQKLGFLTCPVPVFEQLVLCSIIESGDFERNINRVRRIKRRQLKDGRPL